MARALKNRRVSLTGGSSPVNREEVAPTAPAVETENARVEQVGDFRQANIAISQSGVALKVGGAVDSDEGTKYIAGRAGTIVGIVWALTAAATHTAGSIKAAVGPAGGTLVAQGNAAAIDGGGTSAVVDETTPIAFAEGDALGVLLTTDAAWLPITTDIIAWLMIRWAP